MGMCRGRAKSRVSDIIKITFETQNGVKNID